MTSAAVLIGALRVKYGSVLRKEVKKNSGLEFSENSPVHLNAVCFHYFCSG